jgi:hypothetical protein
MHQTEVRAALLLAAIESDRGSPGSALVPDRAALDASVRAQTAVPGGSAEWLGVRTRIAWDRLLPPTDPASIPARAWVARITPVGLPILLAIGIGFMFGAGIDRLAGAPYLRLVEPAIWALIAFNLLVYLLLGLGTVLRPAPQPGGLRASLGGLLGRLTRSVSTGPPAALARLATPETFAHFSHDWRTACANIDAARIRAALHAAAAAVALGLIAGLYVRGLTTDYAVGWESTFLDPAAMHGWVHALLGPAAAISGLPLPDQAAVAAWRVVPGGIATAGGAAAPLIHLHALSLALAVLLPRCLLAAIAWRQSLRLRREFPLPDALRAVLTASTSPLAGDLGRLVLLIHGGDERVRADALAASLPHTDGAPVITVAVGDEDRVALPMVVDTVLLLVAMTATPEPESHGRLLTRLRQLAPSARLVIAIDSEPFTRRFGAWPARVAERRTAWQAFADGAGVAVALLDLATADGNDWRTRIAQALDGHPMAHADPG